MRDSMSKRVFRDAGFLYMLRGILAASCDNLRGKSFRDEVAETGENRGQAPVSIRANKRAV